MLKLLGKYSFLGLVVVLMQGCVPSPKLYESSKFDNSQQAVVITKITGSFNMTLVKLNQKNVKDQSKEYLITDGFFKKSYDKSLYVLEAGIYYINSSASGDSTHNYYTTSSGMTDEGYIVYGAFEVKPGQIGYLPEIYFKWFDNKSDFVNPLLSYDNIVKDLKKGKKEDIIQKMVPINFYFAGSLVVKGEDGKYYLTGKHTVPEAVK